MTITDIKENIDNLQECEKETLIDYINELLILDKRKDSKIMSLRNELKYLKRQLEKVRTNINKIIDNGSVDNKRIWSEK